MPRKKDKKKTSDKPKMIWTLDTETRGLFGKIFRIGCYNGTDYWAFDTFEECYELIKQYADEYENHAYIHNLDFDLSKIAGAVLNDVDFKNCVFIEHNVAIFATKYIILHDSLKLLPSSLDKICKDFGLGAASKIDLSDHLKENGYKDKGDYFERVPADEPMLNEYLKFDCTSLHSVIIQLIKISGLTVDEFLCCPTTASMAMKVFKEEFPDDYKDACSSSYKGEYGRFIEEVVRQGYYGGRTEVYVPEMQGGFHYDVNSLYPYVMKVNEFPIGYYDVYQEDEAETCYNFWKRSGQGGGFAWVKIHVPDSLNIPPLPYHAKKDKTLKNKLIFPTGNLDGVWAFPEIAMAEKFGCVIEKVEQVVFYKKTYPIFKEFVEQFEELKMTSTGAKRSFAKLVQNSLYGKFGMRRDRRTLLEGSEEEINKLNEQNKEYLQFNHPLLNMDMIQFVDDVEASYIQPHLAGYVTAYARILLYEGLMEKSNGSVSYCDTDSIACQNEFKKELIDEHEYGKWKLENILEYGIFLQPKLYMEKSVTGELTLKAKGIPGHIRNQFTPDTYKLILDKIKSGEESVSFFGSENSLFDKEVKTRQKFVSMLKNGKEFDEPLLIKKGMNLRAKQKRNMDYKNNTSTPHKVMDYGKEYENLLLREAQAEELKELNSTPNLIKEKIKEFGFIKSIVQGEQYFEEYKQLSMSAKRIHFRKTGTPIDVWCEEAGEEINNLLEVIK